MDSTEENVPVTVMPTTSKGQHSYLLALPQELLDRIAELAMTKLERIWLRWKVEEEDGINEWQFATQPSCSGFLNLARTSRNLHATAIRLFYAKLEIMFQEEYGIGHDQIPPSPLIELFMKQIGPTNASYITTIPLNGGPPDDELDLLVNLPRLQQLYVYIAACRTNSEQLQKFCDRLKDLRLEVTPLLREMYLDITYERSSEYGEFVSAIQVWDAVKTAVGALKKLHTGAGVRRIKVKYYESFEGWENDKYQTYVRKVACWEI